VSIGQRNSRRVDWERQLERLCPVKKRLIRANPYTCPNHSDSRASVSIACTICNGTGYAGLARGADLHAPPAATVFFLYGDVQSGHGLFGAGGNLVKVLQDIGKQSVGDAMFFCKVTSYDPVSQQWFHPIAEAELPRPDRIIDEQGTLYTIIREVAGDFGDELVFRSFTLAKGTQGSP
jgi:hypothetical protein